MNVVHILGLIIKTNFLRRMIYLVTTGKLYWASLEKNSTSRRSKQKTYVTMTTIDAYVVGMTSCDIVLISMSCYQTYYECKYLLYVGVDV